MYKIEDILGNMTANDLLKVNEVMEKQDVFSKASRKRDLCEKWIPRLIIYKQINLFLMVLFVIYAVIFGFKRETPLRFFQNYDGVVTCAYTKVVNDGVPTVELTPRKKAICDGIKVFNK